MRESIKFHLKLGIMSTIDVIILKSNKYLLHEGLNPIHYM